VDDSRYLRSLVDRYLARELSLESFEDEFVPLVPHFAQLPSDSDAARLASNIELWLAELSQGHRSESEFRGWLESERAVPAVVHLTIGVELSEHHESLSKTEHRTYESGDVVILSGDPMQGISAAETRVLPSAIKDREVSGSASDTQRAKVPA
jgi:hypothetical protein